MGSTPKFRKRIVFFIKPIALLTFLLPPLPSMQKLSNVHNLYVEWFSMKKKAHTHTHTQQNVGYDFPVNEIFMHFLNWWVLLCVKCFIIFRSSEVWFDDVDPEDLEQVTGKRMRLTSEDVDSTCNETLVTGNFEGLVFWYLSSLLFTWPRSRKEWSFFLRQHTFTHQLPLITCVRPISLVPTYVMPSVSIPKRGRVGGGVL